MNIYIHFREKRFETDVSCFFFFSTVVTSGNSVLSEQNISYLLLPEYWCFWNWIWQKLFVNIEESVKYGVL